MDHINNETVKELWLTTEQYQQMQTDVTDRVPEEACGILAGVDQHVSNVFPTTNTLHSPVRFRIEPKEQLDVFNQMDEMGWDLLAIYHSHPSGPDHPSITDIQEAYYPEALHLIWFTSEGKWICKGYRINKGEFEGISLNIVPAK